MNNAPKIFLLEPIGNDNKLLPAKLIWADNEKDARMCADVQLAAVKPPGQEVQMMKDSPYEDKTQVSCRELVIGEDYTVLRQTMDKKHIEVLFAGNNYTLAKKQSSPLIGALT